MELHEQIKKYRIERNLSQEELAEKVYVTRQSISNWETGKTYPDIHSLLLLSSFFNVSLDQLIKGDIKVMKREINETEVGKLKQYSVIYSMFLAAMVFSVVPCMKWLGWLGTIPVVLLFTCSMFFAWKIEKIKKSNQIFTYKEIVAFMEGTLLDELEQSAEVGKRPYQRFFLALVSGVFAAVVCLVLGWLLF